MKRKISADKTMYDSNNIFAKIISGATKADIVYQDQKIIAIRDIRPVAPIHVLVIPKGEYIDYSDFITKATPEEVMRYFTGIAKIAESLGLVQEGYRVVSNQGSFAGQTIFHFHTHIIGGKQMYELAG